MATMITELKSVNGTMTFDGNILSEGNLTQLRVVCKTLHLTLFKQVGVVEMGIGEISLEGVTIGVNAPAGKIRMEMTDNGIVVHFTAADLFVYKIPKPMEEPKVDFGPFYSNWKDFEEVRARDADDNGNRVAMILDTYYRGGGYEVPENHQNYMSIYASHCVLPGALNPTNGPYRLKDGLVAALKIAENAGMLPRKIHG